MCRGGYEIIHIGASLHEVARSKVRVVMQSDQLADGTRKEEVAAVNPKGLLVTRYVITSTLVSHEPSLFDTTR
jgi:hypothetical protein